MADLITRQPTAAEAAIALRFARTVFHGRAKVEKYLAASKAIVDCQNWINSHGIPYGKIVFHPTNDGEIIRDSASQATRLEKYAAGLEGQKLFFRPDADGKDMMILAPIGTNVSDYFSGLGGEPISTAALVIVVAGVVLVVGAISVAIAFYQEKEREEILYKKRVTELDQWAAGQSPEIRAAWSDFKKENNAANPGFWSGLSGAMSGILPFAIIALLALAMFKQPWKSSSSSTSEAKA